MKGQYYRIDWDTCDSLHLYGREAMVYCALIYLCKRAPYKGSATELASFSHCGSSDTALRMLKSLLNKGLIFITTDGIMMPQNAPSSAQNAVASTQNASFSKAKESTKEKEKIIKEIKGGGDNIAPPPPPTYFEIISFGKEQNIPESVCLGYYAYYKEFDWKHKNGDAVKDWKATLMNWFLREKKSAAKSIYQNVYGRATEQQQAEYVGSQYAEYQARKEKEQQEEQARQQDEDTKIVSYADYKKLQ